MEAEINNGGSDSRCRGRLESARDGICNAHRCARRGEGVLEIESNERLVFNDENMVAPKHSCAPDFILVRGPD